MAVTLEDDRYLVSHEVCDADGEYFPEGWMEAHHDGFTTIA